MFLNQCKKYTGDNVLGDRKDLEVLSFYQQMKHILTIAKLTRAICINISFVPYNFCVAVIPDSVALPCENKT